MHARINKPTHTRTHVQACVYRKYISISTQRVCTRLSTFAPKHAHETLARISVYIHARRHARIGTHTCASLISQYIRINNIFDLRRL